MLNNIYLEVKPYLGSDLKDVLFDCRNLAIKLDMCVHCKCNSTLYMISPDAYEDQLIAASEDHRMFVYVGG